MPLVDLTKVKQENVDSAMLSSDKPNNRRRKPAAQTARLTTRNAAKIPKADADGVTNTEKAPVDTCAAQPTNDEPSPKMAKTVDSSTAEEDVPEESCSE